MKLKDVSLSLFAGSLLLACQGSVGTGAADDEGSKPDGPPGSGAMGPGNSSPPGTPGTPSISFFACGKGEPAVPSLPLRRLSARQYRNSIHDVIRLMLRDEQLAAAVESEVATAVAAFPEDDRPVLDGNDHGTFRRLYQDVPRTVVEASYNVGVKLGESLTKDGRLERFVNCKQEAPSVCLNTFLTKIGERVLRAPMDEPQRDVFRRVYGKTDVFSPQGYARVIGLLVAAPEFMYFVEPGDREVAGRARTYSLSAFELAARLSYQYWDSFADDELWQAAASGSLLKPDVYAQQVSRLVSNPRARGAIETFYGEWLRLEDTRPLDQLNADKAYRTFARDGLPSRGLTQAVIDEALAFTQHHTFTRPGKFDELLTSDLAFPRSDELAKLYGQPVWDGKGQPPSFPAGLRPGLLTRAAFLADGRTRTRPIMRGSFVRREILCDPLSPPPADATEIAQGVEEKLPEDVSTRALTVAISEKSGGSCLACHRHINPLGYVFEGFDNLARTRTEEAIISKDTGKVLAQVPVDTRAVPLVTESAKDEISTPAELMKLLLASGKPQTCFARHYVRYTWARPEDAESDACTIDAVAKGLVGGASLRDAFAAIAYAPAFQQRTLPLE